MEVRPGLIRFERLRDAPVRAGEGEMYLYLAVAPHLEKIGISKDLRGRMTVLKSRSKCQLEEVFAILLPEPEARRREHVIKRAFGARLPTKAFLCSEWFDRQHHALALAAMCVPEFATLVQVAGFRTIQDLGLPEVRSLADGRYFAVQGDYNIRIEADGRRFYDLVEGAA